MKKLLMILAATAAMSSPALALEVGDQILFSGPNFIGCESLEHAKQSIKANDCASFTPSRRASYRVIKKDDEYICFTDRSWDKCLWAKSNYAQKGEAPSEPPSAAELEIEWRKRCAGRMIECAREYEEHRLDYRGRMSW